MGVRWTRATRYHPGKDHEAWELGNKLAEHARDHYGLELKWGYQWGGPTGVIYWYMDFDNMGHWEETTLAFVSDEPLQKLMQEGNEVFLPGEDTIVRLE